MATPEGKSGDSSGSKKDPDSGLTTSQNESRITINHDVTLILACQRMRTMRLSRDIHVALTWAQLRKSINHTKLLKEMAKITVSSKKVPFEDAWKKTGPGTEYDLTEGEAAAVLLYTAEKEMGVKVYELVNYCLRNGNVSRFMVFIATLVSALRKLREHSDEVGCVCHWTSHKPVWADDHFVTRSFLSATCILDDRPETLNQGNYQNSVYLIPHPRRAAVIPECLSYHSDEREVIFEPGTVFRRIAPDTYEELPPADITTMHGPEVKLIRTEPKGYALVPPQQTQLLFPDGTRFLPLVDEEPTVANPHDVTPTGDPSTPAAAVVSPAASPVTSHN